jgi:uncharacterized protein YktB (UPF0637 family)
MSSQIITVNEKEIIIATFNNEKYVAIKPICKAIGVNFQKQLSKIKEDEILGQVYTLRDIPGADEKVQKMGAIPLKYVFGWLFTINPNNVKPEVKQDLINYKKECYDALFDTFTKRTSILKEKTNLQVEIEKLEENWKQTDEYKKIEELKKLQKNASQRLNNLDKNIINEQLDLFKK